MRHAKTVDGKIVKRKKKDKTKNRDLSPYTDLPHVSTHKVDAYGCWIIEFHLVRFFDWTTSTLNILLSHDVLYIMRKEVRK